MPAPPLPPAEGCSLPLSTQVLNLRSDIYFIWQEAGDSCGGSDVFPLKGVTSFALKDRKRFFAFFFFPPEVITF